MPESWVLALLQGAADAGAADPGGLVLRVTLGDVLSAAAPIIAIASAYVKLRDRILALELRLEVLWDDYEQRRARRGN